MTTLLVDLKLLQNVETALDFSMTYMQYVKENSPELHHAANGSPSTELVVASANEALKDLLRVRP